MNTCQRRWARLQERMRAALRALSKEPGTLHGALRTQRFACRYGNRLSPSAALNLVHCICNHQDCIMPCVHSIWAMALGD